MNVVIWARVSSREQREGYSIDAQLRLAREKAAREGWNIIREFTVAETAKRRANRAEFNEMYQWVKRNARGKKIDFLLAHKLDRVCRNMRDAVRMQELEDSCGIKLAFVENDFAPGAAGALSFNIMAAVAQYYSDNLQSEVVKGMDEKVRQGWLPGHAPFGYINVKGNKLEPIRTDPVAAKAVLRIFELYALGDQTFELLTKRLRAEGYIYRKTNQTFNRTTLSYILNNRFYVGDIEWKGKLYPGKHQPLIHRSLFDACQDILKGRNRRTGNPENPYAGGLFRCAFCGSAITGEKIQRKLNDGTVRVHEYYKCRNSNRDDHPRLRWRVEELEKAIEKDLQMMVIPDAECAAWFRDALAAAFGDAELIRRERIQEIKRRISEINLMQERCLNLRIAGSIDDKTFETKKSELICEKKTLEDELFRDQGEGTAQSEVLDLYDFSQNVVKTWRGSTFEHRREILDAISSNRLMGDTSLYIAKRSPFDALAKQAPFVDGRGIESLFKPLSEKIIAVFSAPSLPYLKAAQGFAEKYEVLAITQA